jgi:hypothetical protein
MADWLIWGINCVTNVRYFGQINSMNFCLFNFDMKLVIRVCSFNQPAFTVLLYFF